MCVKIRHAFVNTKESFLVFVLYIILKSRFPLIGITNKYGLCAEARVLQEDLDFAAALGGFASDSGFKKKKTSKKATPSLGESSFT